MEWVTTLMTAAAFFLLFAASELALRRGIFPPETTRRLAHAAGAGVAAAFPLYLHLRDLILLAMLFTAFLTWSWLRSRLTSIHGVERPTVGAVVFPAGLALAAITVWPHSGAYAFGALVLALSDPAAAVVGGRMRGPEWRVAGGQKSIWGSVAFFTVTLALALLFGLASGDIRPARSIAAAATLTIVEGALGYGLDNLPLPVLAAALGEMLLGL